LNDWLEAPMSVNIFTPPFTEMYPTQGESRNSQRSSSYDRDGYVISEKVFSPASLSLICGSLRRVLEKSGNGSEDRLTLEELILKREAQDHGLVYKAAQSIGSSASTYQLIGSSTILDEISAVTGFDKADLHVMPMYLIVQLPSDERFDYAWHQDGSYYAWCQDFLTLWFPVNRGTKRDSGTISIIPGSQKAGARESETSYRHGYFRQIESQLNSDEVAQEEILEVGLGDCCIMHGNTVHRSVANRSSSPRVAGVLRIANMAGQSSYERERFYCTHKS
jgi:ectoine hydroxylase-related dioxygenase (phytanoyl-CoA dioxygenase family)